MIPKNKQDWFALGKADAEKGLPSNYSNPTSWQTRAYCDGHQSARSLTGRPINATPQVQLMSSHRDPGKSITDSLLLIKRFPIPPGWPLVVKTHAQALIDAVGPDTKPKKIARHQRALKRLMHRWSPTPQTLAVLDELAQ